MPTLDRWPTYPVPPWDRGPPTKDDTMTTDRIKTQIEALTDAQLEEGAITLKGTTTAERLVRAFLIDEYERRHGPDAAEVLLEKCGL